jgi:dihydrofolate synthase/folylpolyglutamate synthase
MIDKKSVTAFVKKTQTISEEIKPSFFELTFAMSIDYFAQQKVEIAIIETGLGGRLDSTNVITPLLSVITNIGWDHMDILGNTLKKIAKEKAGIIKKNLPVVIGESLPETKNVFTSRAEKLNAPIFFAQQQLKIVSTNYSHRHLEVIVQNKNGEQDKYLSDLNGVYQQNNLLTVLTCMPILQKTFSLPDKKIKTALKKVKRLTELSGRWEIILRKPLVVLDVAHNEDGMRQLLLQVMKCKYNQLHIVIGMVKDKDITKVIAQLPSNAHYYFTQAQLPRALPAVDLKKMAEDFFLNGQSYISVNSSVKAALNAASPNDMVLVCGSIFVVGEVNKNISFKKDHNNPNSLSA